MNTSYGGPPLRARDSVGAAKKGQVRARQRKIKILNGPYTRYHRRDDVLFFDLEKKYFTCVHCGHEISVLDIQVLIDTVSRKLPPTDARRFSMKMLRKYSLDPEPIKQAVTLFVDDFELSKDEPYAS